MFLLLEFGLEIRRAGFFPQTKRRHKKRLGFAFHCRLAVCGYVVFGFRDLRRFCVLYLDRPVVEKPYRGLAALDYDLYHSPCLIQPTDKFVAAVSYLFHSFIPRPFPSAVSECFQETSWRPTPKQASGSLRNRASR